jgi:dCTP deaminase
MSVLTKNKILEEIKTGRIKIEPFESKAVGPGSIDLRLGNTFRVHKRQEKVLKITNTTDFRQITEVVSVPKGESLLLKPGETVLGVTMEKIILASNLCGWLEGRSRFARVGLGVHVSAGFVQPGTANNPVLEITNLSPTPFALVPGIKICQIVFERCEGRSFYRGKFKDQDKP